MSTKRLLFSLFSKETSNVFQRIYLFKISSVIPYYMPSHPHSKIYVLKTFSYLLCFIFQKGHEWILEYFVNKTISKILNKITQHPCGHLWSLHLKIFTFIIQNLGENLTKPSLHLSSFLLRGSILAPLSQLENLLFKSYSCQGIEVMCYYFTVKPRDFMLGFDMVVI